MKKIISYIKLCRPAHYFKNLVIFLAIFFSGNLFNLSDFSAVTLGFVSLSLMSSVNYIINDIIDKDLDKKNNEKSGRPVASGKISIPKASFLAVIMFVLSIIIASVDLQFLLAILAFFALSVFYSLFLKNELFLDIIAISVNFVLRAIAGAFIVGVYISPWLIIGTFFLALFMATGKRKSEILYLSRKAPEHRTVLKKYSHQVLDSLIPVATTSLLLCYALYAILGIYPVLVFTLPAALYIILRYLFLIYSGSEKSRNASKLFTDNRLSLAVFFYIILTAILIYIR
ncbi:decaprenyl-phosphate phosphoribosyltransferase [Candidatus Woesearchaeota archaeon]|nr:decaprenyl-phosphate phosphoribosyltransferase [Candidatus Woesearchaeota archaeon]